MQPHPSGSAYLTPPPRPPGRVIVAGILVLASAGIMVGLIVTILADIAHNRFNLLLDVPIVLLVPGLGWLAFLAYGLFRGRRWSRFGVTATMPILIPLYGLFLVILVPLTLDTEEFYSSGDDLVVLVLRVAAVILLTTGLLLAVVTPLLLLGARVTAYLRR